MENKTRNKNRSKLLLGIFASFIILSSMLLISNVSALPDTISPVITINGLNSINITKGLVLVYTDAGATALDDVDGNLTFSIVTVNPVDVNTIGTYIVTYDVSDSAGNVAIQVTRTVNVVAAPSENPTAPVLGESGRFIILASQKVTTTVGSVINGGDIGIEDQARSYYEGFTPFGSEGAFTELTNGLSYASDDANPLPFPFPLKYATDVIGAPWVTTGAMITQAKTDLGIAYSFLFADPNQPPLAPTQVLPTELGGLTLSRGVYKTALNVGITTGDLTLDGQGDSNSVFIFSIDGTLTTGAPGGNIILKNGAQAKNIYWRTAGITTIAADTIFYGNVFAWQQVNVLANADVTGRLFSVTEQVTLISDTITFPGTMPATPIVTNDDTLNTVSNIVAGMEYKLDSAVNYTAYDALTFNALDFSGDHTLIVRVAAEGINPASLDTTLTFTTNPVVPTPSSGGGGGGGGGHFSSYVREDTVYGVPTVTTVTPTTTTPTEETPTAVPSTTSGLTGAVTGGIKNIAKSVWAWIIVGFIAIAGIVTFIVSSVVKHKK